MTDAVVSPPQRSAGRLLRIGLGLYFAAAVAARVLWLDRVPGLNGDESWYGYQLLADQVSWRTPTGNLVNVFYLGPLALIQGLFGPTIQVLRAVPVLAGLALIVLGGRLLRRSLDATTALVFAVLAAGLPDLVAYARFGWDSSETGLASLAVLHLALRRRWWWSGVAVAAAVLVHPTNVFLAVLVLALLAADQLRDPVRRARRLALLGGALVALAALGLLVASVVKLDVMAAVRWEQVSARITDAGSWGKMLELFADLISGVTVYRYIVGPVPDTVALAHSLVFWGLALPVVLLGTWRLSKAGEWRVVALIAGLATALALLHALFGHMPLTPHFERYGQFLVVPTLILVAWCLAALVPGPAAGRAVVAALVLGLLALASVGWNYFRPLLTTGGQSHNAFRSASPEPKLQVAAAVLADGGAERGAMVLAQDWWLAGPLRYLLAPYERLRVAEPHPSVPPATAVRETLQRGGYLVGWEGGPMGALLRQVAPQARLLEWRVDDAGGRPLIRMWRLETLPARRPAER